MSFETGITAQIVLACLVESNMTCEVNSPARHWNEFSEKTTSDSISKFPTLPIAGPAVAAVFATKLVLKTRKLPALKIAPPVKPDRRQNTATCQKVGDEKRVP